MKTPMQELIDSVGWMAQGLDADELYDYFMKKATQMLEKEKEVIMDAVKYGCSDWGSAKDAENYYNETFKTK
jgi:hypothetical protein